MKTKRIICLLLAALICLSLCACGSKAYVNGYSGSSYIYDSALENPSYSSDFADFDAPAEAAGSASSYTQDRLIVYNADIEVETTDFDGAVATLNKLIADFGATLSNSDVRGDAAYHASGSASINNRYSWYEINVPAEKLDEFLAGSGNIGNVIWQHKSSSDITDAYSDNEIRLATLRAEQQRLTELISDAETISDLIALEDRLSSVSYEIESLESSKRRWDNQLAFSRVTVNLREVSLYTNTGNLSLGQRIADAFKGGFTTFGRGLVSLFIGFISLIPYVIIAAIVVVIIVIIRKKKKKRSASAAKAE